MVELGAPALDDVFQALANPTRRLILERLAAGQATVGSLAEPFDMSLAAVSKHVLVLEAAGIVSRERVGRETHCRLVPEVVDDAIAALEHYRRFWDARLDALEAHLTPAEERTDA